TFRQQIEELDRLLLQMASQSEEMLERSLEALLGQNASTARVVIMKDESVDALELVIDAHILKVLALQQPVATDLRLLLSAQKINNDLERIADHAVNIAEAAIVLAERPHITKLVIIPKMAEIARSMVKNAIDSFTYQDTVVAQEIKLRDNEIDALYKSAKDKIADLLKEKPGNAHRVLHLLSVATDLERVADLATNIAEEVIFIADAEVMKHKQMEPS
ncbi:MAG TPA: phosphate signaling complex protein PhoU, partial [Bacteroidota bacterium]